MELADFEDLFTIHFLWDLRKFYDSIRIAKLIPKLGRLGYPKHIMALGLIAHKAPRILLVGQCCSNIISKCYKSIVAGCQQSCSWARGLMHQLVEALGYVMPGSICYEHVDDLSQVLSCKSKMELYHASMRIGKVLKQGIQDIDVVLSTKSKALSNCNIVHAITKQLACNGLVIKAAQTADDLGIETAAGTRRVAATLNARIRKGNARGKRNGLLAKSNAKAHKLGPTGTQPMQSYGHAAQGASNTQVREMRHNIKVGTNLGATCACTTTTLAWYYGDFVDPYISIRVEQLAHWIDLWESFGEAKRAKMQAMWRRKLAIVSQTASACGPLQKVLSQPLSVPCWRWGGSLLHPADGGLRTVGPWLAPPPTQKLTS